MKYLYPLLGVILVLIGIIIYLATREDDEKETSGYTKAISKSNRWATDNMDITKDLGYIGDFSPERSQKESELHNKYIKLRNKKNKTSADLEELRKLSNKRSRINLMTEGLGVPVDHATLVKGSYNGALRYNTISDKIRKVDGADVNNMHIINKELEKLRKPQYRSTTIKKKAAF